MKSRAGLLVLLSLKMMMGELAAFTAAAVLVDGSTPPINAADEVGMAG